MKDEPISGTMRAAVVAAIVAWPMACLNLYHLWLTFVIASFVMAIMACITHPRKHDRKGG